LVSSFYRIIAYVADYESGLQIIDISNSDNSFVLGSCNTPDYAFNFSVVGNTAYVADYYGGLQIIDISNPQSPGLIGSCSTPGRSICVAIDNTTA